MRAGVRIAAGQLAVALIIGGGRIAIVRYGIRAMQRAGGRRARGQDRRHDEAMTTLRAPVARSDARIHALDTLIRRTAPAAAD